MPKQQGSGPRARIPAAVAAATAATIERAARLLDRASKAVPLRRAKKPGESQAAPAQGSTPSRDDTH